MSKYDELVKALRCKRDDCEGCDLSFFDKDEGWMCQYAAKDDDAAAAIEELQAEVEPRKLGRWEKPKPKGVVVYSDGYAECSSCHEVIWLGWNMNFCPHCGTQNRIIDPDDMAKMGGTDADRPD